MAFDTLQKARRRWEPEGIDPERVHDLDDATSTRLVIYENEDNQFEMYRYWKNLDGNWCISKDLDGGTLSDLLDELDQYMEEVCS